MTIKNQGRTQLLPTQVPAFPFAPVQYEQKFHDQFQRILTQYLTQNDNITGQVVGTDGGRFLQFPHIAASYDYVAPGTPGATATSGNQFASASNVETLVTWNTTSSLSGFTLNVDGTATALRTGVYKIDYSLQFVNTDSQIHEAYVWLKTKTENALSFSVLPGSTSKFSIPNHHGSVDGYLIAYSSVVFQLNAGDSVALYWLASQASGFTTGSPGPVPSGSTGIFMEAYPQQVVGSTTVPSLPSSVGTIAFVSAITT